MGDCKEERGDLTMGRQYGEYRAGMEMEVLLEGSHHRVGGGLQKEGPGEDPRVHMKIPVDRRALGTSQYAAGGTLRRGV